MCGRRKENTRKSKHNREYKDSVFVDLFSIDKETREDAVISLYNALHEQKITNKNQIEFIRLANVLFHKVRNDISFIVDGRLVVLLEHQSTINENMSIRFLEYVVFIFQTLIEPLAKFSQRKINLPFPEFYVIYNGKTSYSARSEQHFSRLFKHSDKSPQLELVVNIININHPDNKDFLKSCPLLKGYKEFSEKVEKYKTIHGEDGYAMAIEECIRENMELSKYLKRKMREVMEMLSAEYSYALELEASRRDGILEGREEGREEGLKEGIYVKAIETARNLIDLGLSRENIVKATGLSMEEVAKL